jgi:hypothetical protein
MLKGTFWMTVAAAVCLCLVVGCESSDSGDAAGDTGGSGTPSGDGGTGDGGGNGAVVTGTYAGTWTGNVCGRTLTMTVTQAGTTLSGSYTLSDPTFTEGFNGTVSSETPPATATLIAGADRTFDLTFNSYDSMTGGYLKSGAKVCDVNAAK